MRFVESIEKLLPYVGLIMSHKLQPKPAVKSTREGLNLRCTYGYRNDRLYIWDHKNICMPFYLLRHRAKAFLGRHADRPVPHNWSRLRREEWGLEKRVARFISTRFILSPIRWNGFHKLRVALGVNDSYS